ncbi:hypothetical protein W911_06850 [Hyphomicrobium nitrativorans NL23]|uniref:Uncharacterized protein n=1 Tax=Hyphomicrobium nitrativorans NL23 TaxID=1029756 RepID=V5SCB1_9HYPH|nr:hypothetical protein [Hyphomicrobium nitrativorans]AHB48163.1 hypothetical protein W911_06850 [Hyphomicrobium nitrativorans NL23]
MIRDDYRHCEIARVRTLRGDCYDGAQTEKSLDFFAECHLVILSLGAVLGTGEQPSPRSVRGEMQSPPSLEKLEQALAFVAQIVLRHGEVYAPILDRLEREVEAARRNGATARAKRILEEFRAKNALAEPIQLTGEAPRQINHNSSKGGAI